MSQLMISRKLVVAVCAALLVSAAVAQQDSAAPTVSGRWGHLPLAFEPNRGQTDSVVNYVSRGPGYSIYLTPTAATVSIRDSQSLHADVLRMSLLGAAAAPQANGETPLDGKVNYLIGNTPSRWQIGVPTYSKVRYSSVYPGIDLVYYGNQHQLEYDFVVNPASNPKAIAFDMQGATAVRINANGELELSVSGGNIVWKKPVAYQLRGETREPVEASYELAGSTIRFYLGNYDHSRALIIDPVLSYGTYIGGPDGSAPAGIVVDTAGNAYIGGTANTSQYPTTPGAYQTKQGGGQDGFITKFNIDGSALIYSTYLGGSQSDSVYAIAVDSGGNAYVSGTTISSDFPYTAGAYHVIGSGSTGFLTKLNSTGSALVYSAAIGDATIRGIALDSVGDVYATGGVFGNFQTTPGAYKSTIGTTNCDNAPGESYVFELSPDGSKAVYSTYISDCEQSYGIAVLNGEAYITGNTQQYHPVTPGAFQSTFGGYFDSFVTRVNTSGAALVYSTYLGGSGADQGNGIAVDSGGNAVVAGFTSSPNYPVQNAFQSTMTGSNYPNDAIVTKLNSTGTALIYSTYLGGSSDTFANAIALDAAGNAYVTGATSSADFPTKNAFQGICGASNYNNCIASAFVTKFNPNGSFLASTFYSPAASWSQAEAIALDSSGNAYIGGSSDKGLLTSANAYERTTTTGQGQGTAFAAKINAGVQTGCTNLRQDRTVAICNPFTGVGVGSPVRVSAVANDFSNVVSSIQVYVDGTFWFEEDNANQIDSYIVMGPGTHSITVKAWDYKGPFSSTRSVSVSGTSKSTCTAGEILPYVQICSPFAASSPANPVNVHAVSATQNMPITSMRLYVNNVSTFTVDSATLNTNVTLSSGVQQLTVQAWDWTGQTFKQTVYVNVQ
jgi:Beta-propeller repeat